MGGFMGKIVEKLACSHDYDERYKIEIKNQLGNIVGLKILLICKKCGKVKSVEI